MLRQFRTIVLIFSAVALTGSAFAQEGKQPQTPEQRAAKLTEWMKKNLQLTEEQAAKVDPINLKYARMTESIRTGSEGRMQKAKAMKANDAAKDAELKEILTPEQFSTYSAKKEEVKEQMRKRKKEQGQG